MKNIFLLFSLLIITHFSCSQVPKQIVWESSIESAFAKAKATGKPVFVECYHPNCPVCMSLEPTLKNAEVGKYYNSNFINYKLNLSDPKQVKFLDGKKIYIPGFPLFLYFDNNQNVIHHSDPNNTPEGLISHGKDALDVNKRSGNFIKKYQEGNRDMNMLIGLAYLLYIQRDTTKNIEVVNEMFKVFPKQDLNSKLSWTIMKKCVMDLDNGFVEHWFNNVSTAAAIEAEGGHAGNEQNTFGRLVQSKLLTTKVLTLEQIAKIKGYMNKIGAGQYIDSYTWQQEGRTLMKANRTADAVALVNKMAQLPAFANNGLSLVYLVTYFNDNALNTDYANAARQWLQKGRTLLKENKDLAEYHYQKARLEQKTNNIEIAKKEAEQAKMYASLAKVDAKKFVELLNSIK